MLPEEVFLSHSDHDREFVSHLANVIRDHGIPSWYSRTNIIGAQQWHDEIGLALNRCDWFVIVLSSNSVESLWVKRELLFALEQSHFGERIIPLLYQDCDYKKLSWTLSIIQMVDFTKNFDDGFRDLFRIWGIGYRNL